MTSIALMESAGAAAKSAGLRYVSDEMPGIARISSGRTVRYLRADGSRVKDTDMLERIRTLAIPPAWTDVWICPNPNGHLQATGRDARGRKQHRYHPDWREARDDVKYGRMLAFGRMLPEMRRRVSRDLKQPGLGREKVLATVTRLLETTLIRVGNEEYARQNGSFGLSTLRDRHVRVRGGTMHFQFPGKSGKRHTIDLHNPRLAKIVREAQELPGQILFQYTDEQGEVQKIASDDVNGYLREIAGQEFSAKDFRTWAATVLAAEALQKFERFETDTQARKNIQSAIRHVAERLGNTAAICRKSYVHPLVLEAYLDGLTIKVIEARAEKISRNSLTPIERAVLDFLKRRLGVAGRRNGGRRRNGSIASRSVREAPASQITKK
ncbi:MAG: DNA topoisomerase IB [Nibricoccus sp.]